MASHDIESLEEKKVKYEILIQDASKAYLDKYYQKASICYFDALTIAVGLGLGKKVKTILKYMMCHCLLECNNSKSKLDDLSEVVMTLQTLDKSVKEKFPAIYCLLAQAHCKLYRFDQAQDVINEAAIVFKKNPTFEIFYIPGTNIEIDQNENNEAWLKVKEDCSMWHKPDAICNLTECNYITKPYVTPNRNIFIGDPAFNGIVIVNCNNKSRPCGLKFHPYCWKFKKDQLHPVQKVSDKDMLGNSCLTPNCMNTDTPCTISSIEIIGADGELKAHIKESTSLLWLGNKNTSKGAIKKVKVPCKKTDSSTTVSKQYNSVIPKQETFTKKQPNNCTTYDLNQIVSLTDVTTDIEFSNDPEHVANTKKFLISLFVSYIGEASNLVTVGEVYSKFAEFTDLIDIKSIKNMDILTFLLETKKIQLLNQDIIHKSYVKQENEAENADFYTNVSDNDSIQDVDDVFYELTNDDDDDTGFSKKFIKNNNNKYETCKINGATNVYNTQFTHEAAGGDAPSHLSDVKNTTYLSNEPGRKMNENKNLKDFIIRLENDMETVLKENENLKQELQEKNVMIKSLREEQEELNKKVEEVESLYNKMVDFEKRYNQVKEENIKLKEETIELITQKNNLENQVSTNNNPEVKRIELVKNFKEEYQILEDCINKEWEKKTEILKETLHSKTETLVTELLSKCMHYQHISNKHLLDRYIHICTITIDIINNMNIWIEKSLCIKKMIDSSDWLSKLESLQNIVKKKETEYLEYVNKLKSDSTDKLAMVGTELSPPELPDPPTTSLNVIIEKILNVVYNTQNEVAKNLIKQQQQIHQKQLQLQQQYQQQTPPPSPMSYPVPNAPPGYPQYQAAYHYGYGTSPIQPLRSALPYPISPAGLLPSPMMPPTPQMPSYKEIAASWRPAHHVQNTNIGSYNNNTEHLTPKLEIVELNNSELKKEHKPEVKPKKELVDDTSQNGLVKLHEHVNNRVDEVQERLTLMQEALKGICISAQEKSTLGKSVSDDEYVTTVEKKKNNLVVKTENDSKKFENIKKESSTKNAVVPVTKEVKPKKKQIGTEDLLKLLLKKYPGTLELDMIEIISEIRKRHNNTLSGIPVSQIIKESEELFLPSQRIHMLRYFLNDGNYKQSSNETTAKEPVFNQQNLHKELLSPASSTSSLNRTRVSSTPKKSWNVITQQEVKWTGNKEIECSICMGIMNKNNYYTLSCRHSFHTNCVKKWLKSDRSCPICRVIVTEDDEFPPLPA